MPQDAMTEDQQLRALLRMKRYEQPPAGYYEKLLQDVHRRQRSELLKRPLWAIAIERVQTFFSEHSMGSASYAGAMAVVALAGLLAINGSSNVSPSSAPMQVATVTVPAADRLPAETQLAQVSPVAAAAPVVPVPRTDLRSDDPAGPRLLSL